MFGLFESDAPTFTEADAVEVFTSWDAARDFRDQFHPKCGLIIRPVDEDYDLIMGNDGDDVVDPWENVHDGNSRRRSNH